MLYWFVCGLALKYLNFVGSFGQSSQPPPQNKFLGDFAGGLSEGAFVSLLSLPSNINNNITLLISPPAQTCFSVIEYPSVAYTFPHLFFSTSLSWCQHFKYFKASFWFFESSLVRFSNLTFDDLSQERPATEEHQLGCHWRSSSLVFLSFHSEDGDSDADNNKVDEDNDDNDDNGDDIDILDDDENVAHSRPSLVVAPHPATSGLSPLRTWSLSTPPYLKYLSMINSMLEKSTYFR